MIEDWEDLDTEGVKAGRNDAIMNDTPRFDHHFHPSTIEADRALAEQVATTWPVVLSGTTAL